MHSRPPISWRGSAWVATFDAPGNPTFATMGTGTPVPGPNFSGNTSTGGIWYTGTDFPEEWQNTYFHGDYGAGWIKSFGFDANDKLLDVVDFVDPGNSVTFVTSNPVTGGIYYVNWGDTVSAVRWVGTGNTPPTAVALPAVSWSTGPSSPCSSAAPAPSDPDAGAVLTYLWNFGDGATSTQRDPLHVFNAVGTNPQSFVVTLTVLDEDGHTDVAQARVSLRNSPPQRRAHLAGGRLALQHARLRRRCRSGRASRMRRAARRASPAPCWSSSCTTRTRTRSRRSTRAAANVVITPVGCDGNTYRWRFTLTRHRSARARLERTASRCSPDCSTLPNVPPFAQSDSATVGLGGSVVIDVLSNDSDLDGSLDPSSVRIASPPSSGAAQVNPQSGAITYTHDGSGTSDSFSYTVDDDDGATSNEATVTVTVVNLSGLVAAYAFEEAQWQRSHRRIGPRQPRNARGGDPHSFGPLWQRAPIQRHQCSGQRARLELTRSHGRDDARGVGLSHLEQRLARRRSTRE